MFSNATVGLLMGIGVGAWVYSKMYHRTGGNNQNSLIVAGLTGALAFLIVVIVMGVIF